MTTICEFKIGDLVRVGKSMYKSYRHQPSRIVKVRSVCDYEIEFLDTTIKYELGKPHYINISILTPYKMMNCPEYLK